MLKVTWASSIDTYPEGINPYPHSDSYSGRLGLQVFDLVTPDGDRVWVVAGWADNGNLHAWTALDFSAGRRPGKSIPDDPRRFAPLTRVNSDSDLRERFISDYVALNHGKGDQEYHIGMPIPRDLNEFVGRKIYPYGGRGTEHVVRDWDSYHRQLILDPYRNPRRKDQLVAVDILEVAASWHAPYRSSRAKRNERPTSDGLYLYRLFDKGGQLLYVGITDNCFRRWKEHSRDKQWWGRVHQFTQDWYPDRRSVELAERRAIAAEMPLFNKAHNQCGGDA